LHFSLQLTVELFLVTTRLEAMELRSVPSPPSPTEDHQATTYRPWSRSGVSCARELRHLLGRNSEWPILLPSVGNRHYSPSRRLTLIYHHVDVRLGKRKAGQGVASLHSYQDRPLTSWLVGCSIPLEKSSMQAISLWRRTPSAFELT
jgi:hypothetical protein